MQMGGEDTKEEEKHIDEEKISKDMEEKEKEKSKDGKKKDKEKKKEKVHKSQDEKKKIKDPAALRAKLESIDAKIEALKVKKDDVLKQLHELEATAGKSAEGGEA